MKEREIVINIENCIENMKQEGGCPDVGDEDVSSFMPKPMSVDADAVGNGENSVSPLRNAKDCSPNSEGKLRKERRSTKKPPRPPRGLSLDAADHKLIKELLLVKRARIERIKALKKTKAAKGMSASASSASNFIAMLFTLVFCVVIIFQGCQPWGNFTRNSSGIGNPISPMSDGARNLSTSSVHMLSEVRSPKILLVPGLDDKAEGGRAIR